LTTSADFVSSCLCVITGASRGLGRELALHLVLVASSGVRREEVRRAVLALQPSLCVILVPADLSIQQGLQAALASIPQDCPERLLLINNAGSLGNISKFVVDFTSPAEITDYFILNVTSFMCLSAGMLRAFPQKAGLTHTVVNISSLSAIKPFKCWSLYCMGKAPDLRVLSCAPGPLDTDMFLQARTETDDPELREVMKSLYVEGNVLTPPRFRPKTSGHPCERPVRVHCPCRFIRPATSSHPLPHNRTTVRLV
uniref:Sepiapterin reductase n=1 Tax=Callorhinchus milii TaxID=7868 RepID=A0A4W3JDI5_CALMI